LSLALQGDLVNVDAALFAPLSVGNLAFSTSFNNAVNGRRIAYAASSRREGEFGDIVPQVFCKWPLLLLLLIKYTIAAAYGHCRAYRSHLEVSIMTKKQCGVNCICNGCQARTCTSAKTYGKQPPHKARSRWLHTLLFGAMCFSLPRICLT